MRCRSSYIWPALPTAEPNGRRGAAGFRLLILFCAFPIGREIFRLAYYGDLLPNTYYLKLTGMPLAARLQSGLGFISLYLITHAVFLGVGSAGLRFKPDRRKLLYAAIVVLPILYQIWIGGDPVRIWRMMTPAQPAGALLFALERLRDREA